MDFDGAIATHTKWKRKLYKYLVKHDRVISPTEVRLDNKCALGQWIYGEGASYSSFPDYTKLKYEHARIHLVASELVRRSNSGEDLAKEVEHCSNSEFSTASSAVVIALMSLKSQAAREPAKTMAAAAPDSAPRPLKLL